MSGRLFAVVPAAGKSVRMGRPKLRLPLGQSTVIEHVVRALREADVHEVVVVIGPHVRDLASLVEQAGGRAHVLDEETPDMRATVLEGLSWLEQHHHPTMADDWLLIPADHPVLEPDVIRSLTLARNVHQSKSVFIPRHGTKRGHPALLAWTHVDGIRSMPVDQGINVYLRERAEETLEVEVTTDSVLIDLDTPEDYNRLCERFNT